MSDEFNRPSSAADIAEAEAFLAAHPDVVAFDLVLIDLNGIARGKIIRRHELLSIYASGRHLPGSILGLDPRGEDVEETGLVWADGDADRRAWPIPGSLAPMPWTSPPRAEFRVSLHELDGSPMAADPRHAMTRQIDAFAGLGMTPTLAFELEFYLVDRMRADDGGFRPARLPLDGEGASKNQVYSIAELDRLEPFTEAVYRGAEAQGLPVETLISEYAPGQFELTLHHRKGGIRAADDLVMLKRLLRGVALRHGMAANFMAKPFSQRAGSGMHVHASLATATNPNLFADQGEQLAPLLLNAIAGLQQTMRETMLIFAPHLNSWRRFSINSYAPIEPSWGRNNRSVAIRVPAGAAANRHVEHRTAAVDANPYLVGATVLAGMRRGIAGRLQPEPECTAYRAPDADALPPDWRSAILDAAGSSFLKEALGERLMSVFLALKRHEYRHFAASVTAEECAFYGDVI